MGPHPTVRTGQEAKAAEAKAKEHMTETKEIVIHDLPDGSYKIKAHPKKNTWHEPNMCVPSIQWSPRTGMTRYEWARKHTPRNQLELFHELGGAYRRSPPMPLGDLTDVDVSRDFVTLGSGARGLSPDLMEKLAKSFVSQLSPDGRWRFTVQASRRTGRDRGHGGIVDTIIISNTDYRTLADWELLVRARSWVFDDRREAVMLMPGQTENNLMSYVNDRPNAHQILSVRE